MSILDHCPGGTLLEPRTTPERPPSENLEEAAAIRQRVMDGLLWYSQAGLVPLWEPLEDVW